MVKRANPVVAWNAPKRRKRNPKPKISLSQLPRSIKPEVRFSDIGSFLTATGIINQIKPTAQGDDGNDFVGSECYLKSVDGSWQLPTTGWTTARASILIAKDPTVAPTLLSPTDKYDHRLFTVLYDEYFTINEKNGTRIKLPLNIKQKYNVAGSAVTEGDVYFVVCCNGSVSQGLTTRTYFTDP